MPGDDLALLLDAARTAGEIALAAFGNAAGIRDKEGGQGPVTDTDLEIDRFLRQRLLAARPEYGWLSEEHEDDSARLTRERVFIVDPIDGTRAFIRGDPGFAISLAVVEAGRATAGVIHLPARRTTYAARTGGGATRNGRPIRASNRHSPDGARVLGPRNILAAEHWKSPPPELVRHVRSSLAWRMAPVAEGAFDAMLTFRPAWEWDIAAGDIICREAGAQVTDRHGHAPTFNRPAPRVPGVIAAPPALHAALLERLHPEGFED